MAAPAVVYSALNTGTPAFLRNSFLGRWAQGFRRWAERAIVSRPQLHRFVDGHPGLAALILSLVVWAVAIALVAAVYRLSVAIMDFAGVSRLAGEPPADELEEAPRATTSDVSGAARATRRRRR